MIHRLETVKGNYSSACDDITAWFPINGVAALMREADERALARRTAREQGY